MIRHHYAAAVCMSAAFATAHACATAQDAAELRVHGAAHGLRVVGATDFAATGPDVWAELAAGSWRVRFGAGSGRPASLDLEVAAGDRVAIAVGADGVATTSVLADEVRGGRIFARPRERGVRVAARLQSLRGVGVAGLVVRRQDDDNCYRFVFDRAAGEVRLERRFGGQTMVLEHVKVDDRGDAPRDLELEVDGFRLLALLDDAPVLHAFDGGLEDGGCGTFAAPGVEATFARVIAGAPAAPLPTVAVVAHGCRAAVVARAPQDVAGVYAIALTTGRPTIAWPTDGNGFELPLLLRPAEPFVLLDCGIGCGEVADDGGIRGACAWPDAPALRLRAAMVTVLVGSPDASELRARLPAVCLRF